MVLTVHPTGLHQVKSIVFLKKILNLFKRRAGGAFPGSFPGYRRNPRIEPSAGA
jgi:hypothetical protein